ncbi:hypothetical protein CD798_03215 [Bacillaceae bacterium SAOS 7]|nr:hypothetical protein CD798_03215 [Bacillaceae bacterium SAOS 7]
MIKIYRQVLGVKIQNIYFSEESDNPISSSVDLVGITQSFNAIKGLDPLETLIIDLTKDEEALLADMTKSTRQQIRAAPRKFNLLYHVYTSPTDIQIFEFRDFYNEFARNKNTYGCNSFHVKTMQLLRNKHHLLLTKIEDENNQTLCFRVYVIDGQRASSLYSASHFRLIDDKPRKRLLSVAHRYLKWKDMIWLKNNGYLVYDTGGLTQDENIRKFKLEFGGTVETRYSGYIANTIKGKIISRIRKLKMTK